MNKPFTPLKNNQSSITTAGQIPRVVGNSAKVIWKTVILTIFMLSMLLGYNDAFAQSNVHCTMVCNDDLNISVGNDCSVTIYYDQILEDGDNSRTCSPNGIHAFTIDVMDENLNVIPTSPTIPYEYVGRTLTVKVKHWATGNNCWSRITLQDKIPPRLNCPADIAVACTQSTDPSVTGQATATDCGSGSNVTFEDIFTDLDCGNPIGKITRIWTAEDLHGNRSQCSQIITINRPSTNTVVFPANLDGISKPAISCVGVNADANQTNPEFTGYPTINGQPITGISGDICKLNAVFTDQFINGCSGSYKILRKWTVLNLCTSDLLESTQIIEVADDTPPMIVVPADITVGTQSTSCFANVPLLPATVTDACSENVTVRITSQFNTIDANGGVLLDIPLGTHTVVYEATDACGNTASQSMKITVIDDDLPVVVCNDETVVSLSSNGTATVFATSFDEGSYDNCCLDKLLVRRVGDADFGLNVQFACTDTDVMVELQVTDCHGNSNSCMINVTIQDKVEPTIVCPADQTIDCEADYSDLSQFGQPQVVDNCGFEIIESTQSDIDNCGVGTVTRTWTAMGSGGEGTSCSQIITIINASPWNANNNQISWPADYETAQCVGAATLDPEDLPAGFNEPTFIGDNACALIATNYQDLILDVEAPACFKILRTWTVIDWCQYEVNNPDGIGRYEFEQIIKVIDDTAPAFGVEPADYTVDMLDQTCVITVTLPNVGVTDCSPNATVTAQGALGSGFGPFPNVMPGVYDMTYIATDGCGNSISKDVKITVRDGKKPTPICIDGLVLSIETGTGGNPASVALWAQDLDAKSFDNCTPESDLEFRIRRYDGTLDTPPGSSNITFTCNDLGTQQVEVWVLDANGNADFCITTVNIQDNINVCSGDVVDPSGHVALSGRIATETGGAVSDVSVQITAPDRAPYMTSDDGEYIYEQLDGNLDYALIPEKNEAPKNGVSTLDIIKMRKHLLNIERFDSPYKYIAADVDQSGNVSTLDLINTRKLILGLIESFPNNESWRFVPSTYVFQENANPLETDFPEIAVVPSETTDKSQIDFMAIKVGDVDYSAQSNGLVSNESRNNGANLFFDLEDTTFKAGETVNVTFKANNFTAILGYQMELFFDNEIVDYQGFTKGEISSLTTDNLGLADAANGKVKISWDDLEAVNVADGDALFSFQFKANRAGQLSDILTLNTRGLVPQAYSTTDEIYDLALNFNNKTPTANGVELLQNQPNPFRGQTTIRFNLPTAQKATLTIFDVQGKMIKQFGGDYKKGTHSITVEGADLPTVGLMYYSLETADEKIIKKMILLN